MTMFTTIRTRSLADQVLDTIPTLTQAPLQSRTKQSTREGLYDISQALGAESFALLQFSQDGTFVPTESLGFQLRTFATAPTTSGTRLLRRLSAARTPVVLTQADGAAVREELAQRNLAWIVGVPARSKTRARGVLTFAGGSGPAPSTKHVMTLAPLSEPLAAAIAATTFETDFPYKDPTASLRRASRRHPLMRMLLMCFRAMDVKK